MEPEADLDADIRGRVEFLTEISDYFDSEQQNIGANERK